MNAVNDAPDATPATLTIAEDAAPTALTLAATDVEGDAVTAYRIDTLPANGTLTLDGVAVSAGDTVTQAEIDAGKLAFEPDADWNGSTSFTFSASDGSDWSDSPATFGITVNPANDAPDATPGTLTIAEDAAPTALTLSGTDIDAGDAVTAYRIDTLPANGTLTLDGVAVSAGDTVTQAEIDAGKLAFEPDANWNGSTSFTFSASDGDDWSAAPATFGITVNPANDAPDATPDTLTITEDAAPTALTLAGADIDTGDAVTAYRIDTLPANGTLTLDGVAVHAGDTVTQSQIDAGDLAFQPDANWNGSTSFTFSAFDGDDWSAAPATFGITVDPANDAPDATAATLTIAEDSAATALTLSGTDIDAGDAVTEYRIDTLPSDGTLRLDGVAVSAGDVITQAEIDAGDLTFEPDANWNGATSFTFSAHDGDAWSATPATFGITVTPTNDAPDATSATVTLTEDDGPTAVTLSGMDIDAGDAVTQYRIDTLPANGTLTLSGAAVNPGDVVTQAQIDAGDLKFEPTPGWNGTTHFTFSAHDGDAWSAAPGTLTLDVSPANDAPIATAGAVTLNEDAAGTVVTLAGTDPDVGDAVEAYRIDTLPTGGTLQLNGVAVSAGDTITQAQIDAGALTFEPDANWSGSTSFTFSTHDGDEWSAASAAFDVTVNAVNDAPEPTAATLTLDEDAAATAVTLAGTDVDAGDAVESYRIDALPEHGTLALNGVEVTAGAVVTQAQIDAGELTFQPDVNWNGTTTLSFSAFDGEAWSDAPAAMTITVNPVNDAPEALAGAITLTDTSAGVPLALTGADEVDSDAITGYRVESLPGGGIVRLDGEPVEVGDFITQAQVDSAALTFTPVFGQSGSFEMGFSAFDGQAWSDEPAVISINVIKASGSGFVPPPPPQAEPEPAPQDEAPSDPVDIGKEVPEPAHPDEPVVKPTEPPTVSDPVADPVVETPDSEHPGIDSGVTDPPAVSDDPESVADPEPAPVAVDAPLPTSQPPAVVDDGSIWDGTEDLRVLDPVDDVRGVEPVGGDDTPVDEDDADVRDHDVWMPAEATDPTSVEGFALTFADADGSQPLSREIDLNIADPSLVTGADIFEGRSFEDVFGHADSAAPAHGLSEAAEVLAAAVVETTDDAQDADVDRPDGARAQAGRDADVTVRSNQAETSSFGEDAPINSGRGFVAILWALLRGQAASQRDNGSQDDKGRGGRRR